MGKAEKVGEGYAAIEPITAGAIEQAGTKIANTLAAVNAQTNARLRGVIPELPDLLTPIHNVEDGIRESVRARQVPR